MKKISVVKQIIIFSSAVILFMTVSLVAAEPLYVQPKKESVTAVTPIENTVAKQITDNNTIAPADSELESKQKSAAAPAVTSSTFGEALGKNQKQDDFSSKVSNPSVTASKSKQKLDEVPLSTAMLLKAEKSADKSIDSDAVNTSKKTKVAEVKIIQSSEQFNELLNSKVPVLVDFFACWSAPCDMINDSIISIASKADGKYKVVKVNADMYEELLKEHDVKTLPTVMLFRDGKEVDKKEGIQQESTYASMLSSK